MRRWGEVVCNFVCENGGGDRPSCNYCRILLKKIKFNRKFVINLYIYTVLSHCLLNN
jgi:hypothetical protein